MISVNLEMYHDFLYCCCILHCFLPFFLNCSCKQSMGLLSTAILTLSYHSRNSRFLFIILNYYFDFF